MKHNVLYTATNVTCGWAGTVIRKANPRIWAGAVTQIPPKTPKKLTRTYRRTKELSFATKQSSFAQLV